MLVKPLVRPIVRAIAGNPTASLGSGFSPTSLFLDGSKGVLYDNNDLSSFYLDSALTTPATVNGLVGGQLDKSGNGFHRTQATTGSKPVLRGTPVGSSLVTNGDFASGTGWIPNTWVISGGSATATNVSDSLAQNISFTAGNVYRVTFTVTAFSGTGGVRPRFFGGTTVTGATRSATGTYVEYMTAVAGNNQFALASTTTTATITVDNVEIVDVSVGSVTAPYGLQYDGVDDFMQTAAVDFTATDKMFVCAGVRKLSDAAVGILVELTTDPSSLPGSFSILAPATIGATYRYGTRGSGATFQSAVSPASYTAPITNVISGTSDIVGDSAILRVNGSQVASSVADLGTGNYANAVMYFGRRAGTSNPLNGLDFGFVICGKTLTSNQISSTERYIAQRTGVTI